MVRKDDSGDVTKCWIDRDELSRLERAAGRKGWQREIAVSLMGRVGLRAHEVSYPSDAVLRWSEKGECWFVEVRGKNTKGGDRATRYAWVPEGVEEDVRKYSRERGLSASDPWVDVSTATLRRWVHEARDVLAEETSDEDWLSVSSHDLRRSWAQYHLVEKNRDVRTMMSIGGWSSYSAIEPYLREPTESRIGSVMRSE